MLTVEEQTFLRCPIHSKEGLAHFVLMTIGPGDTVLCQDPGYPIHQYSVAIAGGTLQTFSMERGADFVDQLEDLVPHFSPGC